jgi:glucosamine-6-phosphate deaminase
MPTTEKVTNWRGAIKELRIDTDKKPVAVEDDELTPDSMSARIVDSAIGMSPPRQKGKMEREFEAPTFDRMGSRVDTLAA